MTDSDVSNNKIEAFSDIGFAKIDNTRKKRQGVGEVIYGEGKTAEQIAKIVDKMKENGQNQILITRLSQEKADFLKENEPDLKYFEICKIAIIGNIIINSGEKQKPIVVCCAGTSDLSVAEEAAMTLEFLGNKTERLYDVGVAGLHRLLSKLEILNQASVIIAVAGMEGALASVIGGLVSCPVVAVPTSVGYGSSFGGLAALLSMLNSCASGVTVVNIDNGFGAAMAANRMVKSIGSKPEKSE